MIELLQGIFLAVGGIFLVLALRSLTTLFHELGHALPALLFTEGPVNVFIGTYGDKERCLPVHLGRLHIYIRFNILDWKIGLCAHEGQPGLWKNLLIVIGGPIASLLIAIPLFIIVVTQDLPDLPTFICLIFFAAAFLDFVVNLIPFSRSIQIDNGSAVFNDGAMLLALLSRIGMSEELLALEALYDKGDHEHLVEKASLLIEQNPRQAYAYRLKIDALLQLDKKSEALQALEEYIKQFKPSLQDIFQKGQLHQQLNQSDQALDCFNQVIYNQYQNADALAARAQVYIEQRDYQLAIKDCDAAIYYSGGHYKAFLYRALAKMRTRDFLGAEKDLLQAQQAQHKDAYLPYYWSKLSELKGAHKIALAYLEEAKAMDPKIQGLDYDLEVLRAQVEKHR